jgi:hypothetical protein
MLRIAALLGASAMALSCAEPCICGKDVVTAPTATSEQPGAAPVTSGRLAAAATATQETPSWRPGAAPNGGCSAWRQTGQCKSRGPREPLNDKTCDEPIDTGWSGFCVCATGDLDADCGHEMLSCSQVCTTGTWMPGQPSRSTCVSWRQTGNCDPRGPLEPTNNRGCNDPVPSGASGFCECNTGNVFAGCGHTVANCQDVCNRGAW